jgi:8-oxo-dGTP diphosphatase
MRESAETPAAVRVLAAVIQRGDRLLVCQRPPDKRHGGLWEFPGGKIEAGESNLLAARRELGEELGVEVEQVGELEFAARDPGSQYQIEFYRVTIEGEPRCLEHSDMVWLQEVDLTELPLAPSDLAFVQYRLTGKAS